MHTGTQDQKMSFNDNVHAVLAHSYASYFLCFLLGQLFHFLWPVAIYRSEVVPILGTALIIFSSILIIWSQKTSRNLDHGNIKKESFLHGPYCYSRMPTHWGLVFLMLGFGLVINSLFVFLFAIIFFAITKLFFIKKEEELLAAKYGEPYREYKKSVRL